MPLICSAPYVELEGLVACETVVIDSAAQADGKPTAIAAAIPAVTLNAFERIVIFYFLLCILQQLPIKIERIIESISPAAIE
jgi:hypothetical protein